MTDLRGLEQTPTDQYADEPGEARSHLRRSLLVREAWAVEWALRHKLTHWHAAGWGCRPGCVGAAAPSGEVGIREGRKAHRSLVYFGQPSQAARRRGRGDYRSNRRLAKV